MSGGETSVKTFVEQAPGGRGMSGWGFDAIGHRDDGCVKRVEQGVRGRWIARCAARAALRSGGGGEDGVWRWGLRRGLVGQAFEWGEATDAAQSRGVAVRALGLRARRDGGVRVARGGPRE